ncbi:ribosomal protein S6 kinase 2 beta-like [Lithobates pipiens]
MNPTSSPLNPPDIKDTMASVADDVEGLLDRMFSFWSQGLVKVDLQEFFLIVKELGEGGYGRVLLANDKITGQTMALKIMDKKKTSLRSFLQEFSVSYLLSPHPNIIGCIGIAFTTIDYFVFAQELAPVGDLFTMILPHVGIPEDAVKRCSVQISNALEFMSEKGLVHMDLKPENILLFDKDCHLIKITDFGLSKVKGKMITSRCGSKSYMAPELRDVTISNGLVVDGSLDVWSFGVIIYCILTGEMPWQVATLDDQGYKCFVDWQNNFHMDKPPKAWRKIPTEIRRMFISLLAIDYMKRSKATEILKYMTESWKEETPDATTGQEDEDPIESCSVQSEEYMASYLNPSQGSVSITSLSYLLATETSGSQSEMTPEPQKDNMEEALIIFDDEFSLHVGAEMTSLDYPQWMNKTPTWYMVDDTMASVADDVEGLLDRMFSFWSQGLVKVDLQEFFNIVKELGEGGYGRVLLANDKITGQTMALKIMDKKKTSLRSFLQEFSVSYFLSPHPNIIGCIGIAFTTIDYFVFAQELAPVGDLFTMILPHVGIPEDAVKRCSVQISNALEFMSEKGLVHMDLKPENILVFDKDCHLIKITDFGLAKVKGKMITSRCGSKSYMAPELRDVTISNGLVVHGSLDVWSFGVIIYCLLTGEIPWQVATLDDQGYKCFVDWQNNFHMDKPPKAWRKIPIEIRKMFITLLAIDYKKRSRATEILKYVTESWKEETPDATTGQEDKDPIESCSVQSEESMASHMNTSQGSVSITSLSYLLTTDTSGSQSEMTPEPQKDNMEEALIIFDDEFSLHVGAEVDIE